MRLSLVVGLVIASATTMEQSTAATSLVVSPCLAANDYTADQVAGLKGFIAATDSATVAFRIASHIPVVADTSIQVVADSTKCTLALAQYNEKMDLGGAVATSLYLIRAGNTYIASNPQYTHGEWTTQLVMDSTFADIAVYLR